jgi:hypothetical protein
MNDRHIADMLRALDRALPELETPVDSLIAAFVRQHPDLTDNDVVTRIRGLDDPARVAQVRGLLAAGHDVDDATAQIAQDATQPAAAPPATREPVAAPSRPYRRSAPGLSASCGSTLAGMPIFHLTDAAGRVSRHATYRAAMAAKVQAGPGATLTAEAP